ncbi:S41 family peptidase [Pleionea sediminis]|uniref:S41 family peptidase n=1 Tax=Pleionea sediminis TaxID=2569479 RepID=UPI0011857893|nr:S41 family peptidase [Pleionea sediminis]
MSLFKFYFWSSSVVAILALTACGGGSGSGNDNGGNDPVWTQGVFEDETEFENLCESPRSGADPFNANNPYPDQQGTLLDEMFYLRSWNNRTYLWYDEVQDQNPSLFSNPVEYFGVLKTNETTASGNPKDKFHFTYDTAEYNQLTQSGTSAGYGIDWAILRSSPPREIVIAFTEAGSPADNEGLARGARILEVDGVDAVNNNTQAGVDVLNAALFPSEVGVSHTFTVLDLGSNQERTVTLTTESVSSDSVLLTQSIDTPTGKVGYIVFNTFNSIAEEQLVNSFTQLANESVNDLVLDLRYNGGGFVAISAQLGYMIAGSANTDGRTFSRPTFNDKYPTINPVTGQIIQPTPFYSQTLGFSVTQGQALPSLNLDRVYILSTSGTCSASESLINGLRGIGIEVILVGETTCGKPYGFYQNDNCGTSYFTIQMKAANDLGFGDYSDGFSPSNTVGSVGVSVTGCSVGDDFDHLLGDTNEELLSAALNYRSNGTCPSPSGRDVHFKYEDQGGLSLFDSKVYQKQQLIRNNQFIQQLTNPMVKPNE